MKEYIFHNIKCPNIEIKITTYNDTAAMALLLSVTRYIEDYNLKSDTNVALPKSRCCGMCDGVNDICVTDMICQKHSEEGCEICYGSR